MENHCFCPEYLRRLRARDSEISEHFYGYFSERITVWLRLYQLQTHVMEDVIQDVLLLTLQRVYEGKAPKRWQSLEEFVRRATHDRCRWLTRRRYGIGKISSPNFRLNSKSLAVSAG